MIRRAVALRRMMGGDITVESTPDVGSTFTIRLPRIVQSGETLVTEPVHSIAENTEEPLILVVDDTATVRELVVRHLERAGFAVVAALRRPGRAAAGAGIAARGGDT